MNCYKVSEQAFTSALTVDIHIEGFGGLSCRVVCSAGVDASQSRTHTIHQQVAGPRPGRTHRNTNHILLCSC